MSVTQIVIASIAVAVVVNVAVFGYLFVSRRRRVARYREWAAAHGASYVPKDDSWLTAYPWGRAFGIGHKRHVVDVIDGVHRGRPMTCFTYRYTTRQSGNGDEGGQSDNHYVAMHTLVLPRPVPYLCVAHRPFFWEATRDFDAVFEVRTDVPDFGRDVLTPDMQQWVIDHASVGFTMARDRTFVAVGGRMRPERIEYWLDYLVTVVDRLPAAAWS